MLDFNKYNIPKHTQEALTGYIEKGVPVNAFLNAVLANDLQGAISSADSHNLAVLKDIVNWLHLHAPEACHGSEALYRRWLHEHPVRAKGPLEVV